MAKQVKKAAKPPKKAKYDTSIKVNAKPDELLNILLTAPAKKKK